MDLLKIIKITITIMNTLKNIIKILRFKFKDKTKIKWYNINYKLLIKM